MYAVYVYAEGGDYDGQQFIAGPFPEEDAARTAEAELTEYGQTEVLPMYEAGSLPQLVKLLHDGAPF